MAGAGNSARTLSNARNMASVKPLMVCGRWRELSRLLLGDYGRVLQGGKVMDEVMYWSDLAELTHTTQVEKFNFCVCEDNEGQENPYEDCPKEESK